MPPIKFAEVIINASSGVGVKDEMTRRVANALNGSGLKAKLSVARSGSEVVQLARRAARNSSPLVVAGGGDGTINAVASALVDSDQVLGVLPLGTFNHFAKDLGIPLDLEAATEIIVAGQTMKVDVGEVNGRIFLNNSSLGLYPQIVREREKQQRLGYRKWPAFVWAALTVLRRFPFLDVRLNVDGNESQRRTPFVFVGNNEYAMKSFNIGIRERLNAGQLSLYMINRTSRWGLARLALRALLGRIRADKDFLALTTEEVWIATRHKSVRVAFDGEIEMMKTPLHYRVRPGALRVIVPVPDKQDS